MPGPVGTAASPRRGAGLLAVLLTIYALAYLDRQIISLLVEPLKADLSISDVEVSFLQGMAFVLFYTLCGLPLGYAVDRFARRWVVLAGVVVWSCSSAAGAFAETYHQLLFARFGVGAGEAALLPAAYSMIGDAVDRSRLSRSMSIFSLGATVGGALALGLGGLIAGYAADIGGITVPVLGHFKPWQVVFLAIGSMGIPAALLILAIREPTRTDPITEKRSGRFDAAHFAQNWGFYLCHIAGFSLLCMLIAAVIAWQPSFMLRSFGWDIRKVGGALGALHMVGGILGMLGGGILADHLQKRGYGDAHFRIYVFVLPIVMLVGMATYWSGSLWIALVGIGVTGIVSPFIGVAASGLALGTPPNRRGLTSAVFLFAYNLVGFGLGPMVAAWLAGHGPAGGGLGWALGLMFAIITPLVVGIFWIGLRPMRKAVAAVKALESR